MGCSINRAVEILCRDDEHKIVSLPSAKALDLRDWLQKV